MTQRDESIEAYEASDRLTILFSDCPANCRGPGHVWDMDSRKCTRCGKTFPYADGENVPAKELEK